MRKAKNRPLARAPEHALPRATGHYWRRDLPRPYFTTSRAGGGAQPLAFCYLARKAVGLLAGVSLATLLRGDPEPLLTRSYPNP